MKAPLEHLESSTPMSAGEGTLYALIGGALIGLGFVVGWTKASLKNAREIQIERRSPNTRRTDKPRAPQQ
jgi:hypothetical protein